MYDQVVMDTIFWTFLITGIWYYRKESAGIRRLLQSWGLPISAPPIDLPGQVPEEPPEVELRDLQLTRPDAGRLRLRLGLTLRRRVGKRASVLVGLLGPEDRPLEGPATARTVRFPGGFLTLGGELDSPYATVREAAFEDLVFEYAPPPEADLRAVRLEVWVEGTREATARLAWPPDAAPDPPR